MPGVGGVGGEAYGVQGLESALHRLPHEHAELARGRVEPGCVDEDHLGAREVPDPRDPIARGLRPWRYDRQLLAHEPVEERRLARIRPTDQRDESCSEGGFATSEGDFVPLPTVVARLRARSSLPPPRIECAGGAGARKRIVTHEAGPSKGGGGCAGVRIRGWRARGGA